MSTVNRLVLASLNQGARLLGRMFPPSDPVVAAAMRGGFDFPDGDYGPHDYAEDLTEREAEEECSEPQEMPDELWDRPSCAAPTGCCSNRCLLAPGHDGEHDDDPPAFHSLACDCPKCCEQLGPKISKQRPTYCGNVSHTPAGTFVCDRPAGHAGAPYWGHKSGGSMGWGVAPPAAPAPDYLGEWRFSADELDLMGLQPGDRLGNGIISEPINTATSVFRPHSSAARPPVVAGASPGGATHPAPPGERESGEVVEAFIAAQEKRDQLASDLCDFVAANYDDYEIGPEWRPDLFDWLNVADAIQAKYQLTVRARLYPMQPRPETEAQK